MGKFEIGADEIVFEGGVVKEDPNQPVYKAGVLVSDRTMVNGRISAKVTFQTINPNTVCELIVGYDTKSQSHVSAGLGGSGALFSIREWVTKPSPEQGFPGSGSWRNISLGGDRDNLRPGLPYEIVARTEGSTVLLDINGVRVAEGTLARALNQPRQVGVFCLSSSTIRIRDFESDAERPKAFIVMQFSSPYNEVYSHVIKDACEEFSIEAVRADEIYGGAGIIIKDVIDRITHSQVIIADISPTNPNVYFEVGYALALGKPIILLAQKRAPESPLPFDVSAFRVLFYDDSIGGKPKLEEGLRNHLREILGRR
jgi:hypothetical protein